MRPVEMHMTCRNYENGYKLCSELNSVHASNLKAKLLHNF